MKRITLSILLLCTVFLTARATRETYHVEMARPLNYSVSKTTKVDISLAYLAGKFGYWDQSEMTINATGPNAMQAEVWGTDSVFTTFTNATGHWFNADGRPSNSNLDSNRRIGVKLVGGQLCVAHRVNTSTNTYVQVGEEFRFAELFIHGKDTVRYELHVTMVDAGTPESVSCDQKQTSYVHRADQTDDLPMMAVAQRNDEAPLYQNWIQVHVGDRITLDAIITDTVNYDFDRYRTQWKRAGDATNLRTMKEEPFVLTESATTDLSGQYELTVRCYKKGKSSFVNHKMAFYVDVQANPGEFLDWTGLVPEFSYNFKDEFGDLPAPQNILGEVGETDRYGKPVNRVSGDWWTVCWGSNLNSECGTDTATVYQAARNLIKKYETDFAYIRDVMGWPPDVRARKGYKSTVYIFGSGLKNDNEANTTQGGYQSALWYSDPKTGISMNWPCVWASYYPFSRFRSDADRKWGDGEYQREAMIHEGIHALFADMNGVKQSAWFHEAGNTWLQSAMAQHRSGTYGTPGFLDGCPFVAPFMPIECYSGWLQDGSFGGPSAEGVNMYNANGQQVCTWRTYLGGNQYGNAFPIILSTMCGDGSIPWIWRNCKTRVLEGIGDFIGDEGMRNLIMQYRARQACFDFGGWSNGYRQITSNYFGTDMGPEWAPYNIDCGKWKSTCYQRVRVNDADGWLAPDQATNPGWSGANIIPIHVDTKADRVTVRFRPEDTEERALLCYKTKAGKCYYSQMVRCGEMSIDISDAPANGVIFCVVANTDYRYTGEAQRKNHWDYRIHLGDNCLGIGDQYKKWFMNEQTITDNYVDMTPVEDVLADETAADADLSQRIKLLTSVIRGGSQISVDLTNVDAADVSVRVVGINGVVESAGRLSNNGTYTMPSGLRHGLYFLTFIYNGQHVTYKAIVQ